MKKVVIIVIILVCGAAGYLYYDWHIHRKKMAAEPSITLYSWTDEEGAKHFTDTPPPKGARDVETSKGYKYVKPPLVVQIKAKTIEFYKWIKKKIFKKKEKKKERQNYGNGDDGSRVQQHFSRNSNGNRFAFISR